MRVCVIVDNLAVMINGCPTQEINIQKKLKQRDLLTPFLFLLVAEGLGGLVERANENVLYSRFMVGLINLVETNL